MLSKAIELPVDEVIGDLEDSVAVDSKESARESLAGLLERAEPLGPAIAVRVNSLASPWGERDVVELVRRAGSRIGSLVVTKVESARDVAAVESLLDDFGEHAEDLGFQALVETAAGLLHVGEIAAASSRLEALIIGYADLAASLGRGPGASGPESWVYAQETVLVAARAHGLQAIDGPYLEIKDDAGLRRRAEHARALGFDGKWAVHPAQVGIVNAVFTPAVEELARAQSIVDALSSAKGRGALELEGEMIDEASRKWALEMIARAHAAGMEGSLK
jgi:citrate lyase subunit beta/citryl-CoA lyase